MGKWIEKPAGNSGSEVTTEGIRNGASTERWRERVAATMKLRAPNDVWTNGAERRLVLESLRERVE